MMAFLSFRRYGLRAVLVVALALAVCAPAGAQGLVFDTFGRYLESFRVQARIPGLSAAVVGSQGIVWEGAFGFRDVEQRLPAETATAFHFDGVTQLVTASLVLRCMEDGLVSLDDRIGRFSPDAPEANATVREILTHVAPGVAGRVFVYRPDRLGALAVVVSGCTGVPFRDAFANWLPILGMHESVPGPDAPAYVSPTLIAPPVETYVGILARLAVPYRVADRRFIRSVHPATTLSPAYGLISTVRDLARFDLALRGNLILQPETRALAWSPPAGPAGTPLPHGLGWFVQAVGTEQVVWQFGYGEHASSSLVITLPARDLTLILAANSDTLARPFAAEPGALLASPFARLFLEVFAG